uniref:FkbM family methyltransferase n=1 Tax=Ignisphaera aggregans TaxID=334771 RepID=A0A7J2U3Z6_9CREN
MLRRKLFKYVGRALKIIDVLGLYEGLLYLIKAKILRSKTADAILWIALRGEKIVEIDEQVYMWRGKKFYVPTELAFGFLSVVLPEIIADKIYILEGNYDVILDIGGFLGETAWWFITEGYAKKVIVFEPVYYDLCRSNIGDVAEVHPQAIHWRKEALRFEVKGLGSRSSLSGERVSDATTLSDVLNSLSGNIAVKMNCEGCEKALIYTPCDVLKKVEEYIVEIHPWISMESVVRYMESCGFNASLRLVYSSEHAIYHFRRRH